MSEDLNAFSKNYAIIVAGGSGTRMQSAVPKQFLLLNGRPVLMHTIEVFNRSDFKPSIIVVLPCNFHDYWKTLCSDYNFHIPHQLVDGGTTRFHSVKKALAFIPGNIDCLVAVQDAVRPLTTKDVIDASFNIAGKTGNAVVAVKSRDSVRVIDGNLTKNIAREDVFLMQTPQTFESNQLKEAYKQEFNLNFTDDASVIEKAGFNINIIEGSFTNIKITYPEDLQIAQLIIKKGL